jgi:hypothetical protein
MVAKKSNIESFASASLQVVEGMDVVKTIEGVGSQSGATRSKVVIASCGQL